MVFDSAEGEQSFEIVELKGTEDQPLVLDLFDTGALTGADFETLSISIKNLPEGTTLEVGGETITADADGVFTLSGDYLGPGGVNLGNVITHLPANYGEDMALDVSIKDSGGELARSYMSIDMATVV